MNVMGSPEVQGNENISLRYRDTKIYEYTKKEGHGLSRNIIFN